MSINVSSNFLLSAQLPLDARTIVADNTARDAIPTIQRYIGFSVYVTGTANTYQLQTGLTNSDWVSVPNSVLGTANQITATPSGSTVTLSIPQSIAFTSTTTTQTITRTDTAAGTIRPNLFALSFQPGSNSSTTLVANTFSADVGTGIAFTTTRLEAIRGAVSNSSSNILTDAVCFRAQITNTSAFGTVTNATQYLVEANALAAGSIVNSYGLRIVDQTVGTNKFPICFEGTGTNNAIYWGTSSGTNTYIYRSADQTFGIKGVVEFPSGVALDSTKFTFGRNANTTNQWEFNSPTGSGYLWSINGVNVFNIDSRGYHVLTPVARAGGSPTLITVTAPNHTALTASTSSPQFAWSPHTVQWATGALTEQNEFEIGAPTYAFQGSSTLTTASTIAVSAPIGGTNATISKSLAFWAKTGGIQNDAGMWFKVTTSAAGSYTILKSDFLINKTGITGGGDSVTLPAASAATIGQMFIVVDGSNSGLGSAATNNINVTPAGSDLLDGANSAVPIQVNGGVLRIIGLTSTSWKTI